ncbi:MAG: energy transducer TonB [Candidatus Cloacimonetes bacterium]|nr:energy transducer TonB [Candidatus Cloacimonadota bacterium]
MTKVTGSDKQDGSSGSLVSLKYFWFIVVSFLLHFSALYSFMSKSLEIPPTKALSETSLNVLVSHDQEIIAKEQKVINQSSLTQSKLSTQVVVVKTKEIKPVQRLIAKSIQKKLEAKKIIPSPKKKTRKTKKLKLPAKKAPKIKIKKQVKIKKTPIKIVSKKKTKIKSKSLSLSSKKQAPSSKKQDNQSAAKLIKEIVSTDVQILELKQPKYPLRAKRRGMQGVIIVEVTIGINDNILNIKTLKSTSYSILDQEVYKTIKRAKVKSATINNTAVKSSKNLKFVFDLT